MWRRATDHAADGTAIETDAGHAALGDWGVETRYIDRSVDAGDDFFRYVNGGWLDTAELPSGFPFFGSFVTVRLETEKRLRTIVDDILAGNWPADSVEGQLTALYSSFTGEEFLSPMGLSAGALVERIDVPANRISEIVAGRRGVTGDPALRLAAAFGTTAKFWMALQRSGELKRARGHIPQRGSKDICRWLAPSAAVPRWMDIRQARITRSGQTRITEPTEV